MEQHFKELAQDEIFQYNTTSDRPDATPQWGGLFRKWDDTAAIDVATGEKVSLPAYTVVAPFTKPWVDEYNISDGDNPTRVRKGTRVTLPGGKVVKFINRLARVDAVEQAKAHVYEQDGPDTEGEPLAATQERRVAHLVTRGAIHQGVHTLGGQRVDTFTVHGRTLTLHQSQDAKEFQVYVEAARRDANDPTDLHRLDQGFLVARDFTG